MRWGARARSGFYLKRFPDLLGYARGEFNSTGLLMHDGKRHHWFGPSHMASATLSKQGIRVPLPGHPYRYLAFSRRLMLTYSLQQAHELHAFWRKRAARSTPSESNPVANLWPFAMQPPAEAIAFKGYCHITEPLKSTENKTSCHR
jgi:hypothetical protein